MELTFCLNLINKVFAIDLVLGKGIDEKTVKDYYTQSEYGYRKVHSSSGCIHMALNDDGIFDVKGYYQQPEIIHRHIAELKATEVLEIGCGKGFNSIHLARKNSGIQFTAIDLTPAHVKIAKQEGKSLSNLRFEQGNFQKLGFGESKFDIVFGIETVCHASDIDQVLTEVYRVLKRGGRFIIFDGFRKSGFEQLSPDMATAAKLVEISMALDKFFELEDVLSKAVNHKFKVFEVNDKTKAIMPTLLRLQRIALKYFKFPWLAKFFRCILPKYLVGNSIAGLLMPFTFGEGTHTYNVVILEKQ